MNHTLVNLTDISKSFGEQVILDKLNLSIRENEFLTLLGPSGCGKTTTLRILGGFMNPRIADVLFLTARILPTFLQISETSTPYFRNTRCFPI